MRRLVVYDTMAVAKLSYYNTVAGYIRTKRWIQLDCKGSTISLSVVIKSTPHENLLSTVTTELGKTNFISDDSVHSM